MSFNFAWNARTPSIARGHLSVEHCPQFVKDFIEQGLLAIPDDQPVYVKAVGHLFDGEGYGRSTADIEVVQIFFREEPAE